MRALLKTMTLLVLAGCGPTTGLPQSPPAEAPDIAGVISRVSPGIEGLGTVLIEEDPQAQSGSKKASTRITAETHVWLPDGRMGMFADLREGQQVKAWFTGPVAESYPVQATASDVAIQ